MTILSRERNNYHNYQGQSWVVMSLLAADLEAFEVWNDCRIYPANKSASDTYKIRNLSPPSRNLLAYQAYCRILHLTLALNILVAAVQAGHRNWTRSLRQAVLWAMNSDHLGHRLRGMETLGIDPVLLLNRQYNLESLVSVLVFTWSSDCHDTSRCQNLLRSSDIEPRIIILDNSHVSLKPHSQCLTRHQRMESVVL